MSAQCQTQLLLYIQLAWQRYMVWSHLSAFLLLQKGNKVTRLFRLHNAGSSCCEARMPAPHFQTVVSVGKVRLSLVSLPGNLGH